MSDNYYEYKLLYLMPEVPQGHEFRSRVENLDTKPELWQKECPYLSDHDDIRYVDIVKN